MYIKVCTKTSKESASIGARKKTLLGPRFKMANTVLEQHIDSLKIANVTSHLKDNSIQIHISIRKILQMGNFLSYNLKMVFLKFREGRQ